MREWLAQRGIDAFLPTFRETVKWSDRETERELPLFPGYIFARIHRASEVNDLPGVLGLVGVGDEPTPIAERDLDDLRRAAQAAGASPCAYVAGDVVEVARGPLAGVRGIVKQTKGATRLIVVVELFKRAVSVRIDAADLQENK